MATQPTLVHVNGFEHKLDPTTWASTFLYGAVSGTGLSIDTTDAHAGGLACCKIDGTTALQQLQLPAQTVQHNVVRFLCKIVTKPTSTAQLMSVTAGGVAGVLQLTTGGVIQAQVGTGTVQSGPTLLDSTWHYIEFHYDTSTATFSLDWQVDGAVQSQASEGGHAASNCLPVTFRANNGLVWRVDDVVQSTTNSDYPIGNGRVVGLPLAGVGTHNLALGDFKDDAGASIATTDTTSYAKLTELVVDTTTYVYQAVVASTEYLEYTLTDSPDASAEPNALSIAVAIYQDVANAGVTTQGKLFAEGVQHATTITLNPAATATKIKGAVWSTRPAGGEWTVAAVNDARIRLGFQTGVTVQDRLTWAFGEADLPYTEPGSSSSSTTTVTTKTSEAAWRVLVCDRYGQVISNVSSIAFGKQLVATLNRPGMFSFKVPSSDVRVAGIHTDGYPYLSWGNRTVRAYRRELQHDGTYSWVQRFGGHVWQLEDAGDAEQVWTTVTCFDPLQLLNRRIARRMRWTGAGSSAGSMGNGYAGDDVIYDFDVNSAIDGGVVAHPSTEYARGLLAATNRWDGQTLLGDYYGTWASLGLAIGPTPITPSVTVHYSLGTKVGDAILSLVQTYNHFDLEVVNVDAAGYAVNNTTAHGGIATDYDGLGLASFKMLGLLKYWAPQRGVTRPAVVFAWGCAPHTASAITRAYDSERAVNNMYMTGVTAGVGHAVNATSVAQYPVFMDSQQASDGAGDLSAMANEAAQLLGRGAPTLDVTPMAGRCPLPWDSFDLGDTVQVAAGAQLRGGFRESHRVYGYTLDILDDHTTEVLSQVVTSPV